MNKNKKILIYLCLVAFLIPSILLPLQKAGAVGAAVIDAPALQQRATFHTGETIDRVQERTEDKVENQIFKTLVLTATMSLRNIALYLSRTAAEQVIHNLATGDWNKGPLFETQKWGDMLKDESDYISGQIIEAFAEDIFAVTGFDICAPKVDIKIWLTYSLMQEQFAPRKKPYCTISKVTENWDVFIDEWEGKFSSLGACADGVGDCGRAVSLGLLDSFGMGYYPTKTDFGLFLTFNDEILAEQQANAFSSEKDREEAKGFRHQTNRFGTKLAAPAEVTRGMAERDIVKAEENAGESSYKTAQQTISSIPEQMLSTFLSTLMSRGMLDAVRKAIMKGFSSTSEAYNPKQKIYEFEKAQQAAVLALQTTNMAFPLKEINLMSEYVVCPKERAGGLVVPSINNCVVDQGMFTAVMSADSEKSYTIQEAMRSDLIHKDWQLVGPNDNQNANRNCYAEAYCYSNLVKLRKARVISVGWEMAAKKVEELQEAGGVGYVTLGEVVNGFYDLGSPWYHLIDPNWILKSPLQRCRVQGYNNMLLTVKSDSRQEVCVDVQDCIETDINGNCVGGWGYCRADKNVWRFSGQTCEGQYDSCRTLERRDGKDFNYLINTLAQDATCNENTVGCKWYSLWKEDGEWSSDLDDPKLLANKFLADNECKPNEEGCSRFVTTTPNLGVNLLPNAGFESSDGFAGWAGSVYGNEIIEVGPEQVFTGDSAVKVTTTAPTSWKGIRAKEVKIAPQPFHRFFIFSAYIYVPAGENFSNAKLDFTDSEVLENYSDQDWHDIPTDEWTRKYVVLKTEPGEDSLLVSVGTLNQGIFYVDATMLEEIDPLLTDYIPSAFEDYAGNNFEYLKKAPDYYNCYDLDFSNDADECMDKFARVCSEDQVGCEEYTKTATSAKIFGIPSYYDYCPSACNGYDAYEQSKTDFEQSEFPVYMIADNAQSCSGTEVGCDEFTNLDILAQGGEGKEYYSELRHCHEPEPTLEQDPACANFYTWTGSDQSGYQLIAYKLRNTDQTDFPDGPDLAGFDTTCNETIYQFLLDAGVVSDCREFFNEDGQKSYRSYTKTISCSNDCHPYRRTIANQADCTPPGGSWEAGECIYMAVPDEGKTCSVANSGCREYQGTQSGNVQTVFSSTFEQEADVFIAQDLMSFCASSYVWEHGGQTYNVSGGVWAGDICVQKLTNIADGQEQDIEKTEESLCGELESVWDDGQCLKGTEKVFSLWEGGIVSSDSVVPGGHSLHLDKDTMFTSSDLTGKLVSNQKYSFSFWAKKDIAEAELLTVSLTDTVNNKLLSSTLVALDAGDDWKYYPIANISFSADPEDITLKIQKAGNQIMNLWLDDIKIHTVDDVQYLLKPSVAGSVPAICDEDLDGNAFQQVMLGCSEYRDRAGTLHYLKSFSNLCSPNSVGCKAYLDTYNSISPFEQKFSQGKGEEVDGAQVCNKNTLEFIEFVNSKGIDSLVGKNVIWHGGELEACEVSNVDGSGGSEYDFEEVCVGSGLIYDNGTDTCHEIAKMTVPADELIYLIDEKKVQCGADSAGCSALGAPGLDSNKNVKQCEFVNEKWYKYGTTTFIPANECNFDPKEENPVVGDQVYNWETVFYKLRPDDYNEILCGKESIGCEEFVTTDNQKLYFFDPGETVCEYKKVEYTDVNGYTKTEAGWFEKESDLEACKKDGILAECICASKSYYKDGIQNLVHAEEQNFSVWAGECKKSADKCVGFVEPSDKSLSDKGTPYYYINNDLETCSSVNQFEGCMLFNDTSLPELLYSSYATYKEADQKKSKNIQPVSDANANDANKIFQVKRDRECAEWYTCAQGKWTFKGGQYQKECDLLGVCKQIDKTSKECSDMDIYFPDNDYDTAEVFDREQYRERSATFTDIDYTGYMIPGMYPLNTLKSVDLDPTDESTYGLAFAGPTCDTDVDCPGNVFVCSGNKRCVKSISDQKLIKDEGNVLYYTKYKQECRAYPEENSPFPEAVTDSSQEATANTTDFDLANTYTCSIKDEGVFCSDEKDFACAGGYAKVSYGSGMKMFYVPTGEKMFSNDSRVCQNLDNNGKIVFCTCETETGTSVCQAEINPADCGSCLMRDKDINVYLGWPGYCLEKDLSNRVHGDDSGEHPCLNWYPIDTPEGIIDVHNYIAGAGYVPTGVGGEMYCVEPALFKYPMAWADDRCIDMAWDSYGGEKCNATEQDYFQMFEDLEIGKDQMIITDPEFELAMWELMEDDNLVGNYFADYNYANKNQAVSERARCMYEYVNNENDGIYVGEDDAGEKCPVGHFPVFGPCGAAKITGEDSVEYNCAFKSVSNPGDYWTMPDDAPGVKHGEGDCGMLCVPYGSKLNITAQRINDLNDEGISDKLLELANFNGKECFPGLYYDSGPASSESNIIDKVKGLKQKLDTTAEETDQFFSILYMPYKYCEGPGYLVEGEDGTTKYTGYDYGIGCYETAQVAEKDPSGGAIDKTKAWTNKLLSGNYNLSEDGVASEFEFYRATNLAPFGSMNVSRAFAENEENLISSEKLFDLIELTYCAAGNKLTLPSGGDYQEGGATGCVSGQVYGIAPVEDSFGRGKSYGKIEATALKPKYCAGTADCYFGEEEPECDKEDLKDACEDSAPKAWWLWRDGCYWNGEGEKSCSPETQAGNVLPFNVPNGNYTSYVSYKGGEFEFWKRNVTETVQLEGPNIVEESYDEVDPFGGKCKNYVLCNYGPLGNANDLICGTPEWWQNNEGKIDQFENDVALGCSKGKTPNDVGHNCEKGSHIILCIEEAPPDLAAPDKDHPDAEDILFEDVTMQLSSSKKLITKNEIEEPYISSLAILEWLGGTVAWPIPNQWYCRNNKFLQDIGPAIDSDTLGSCSGDSNLLCLNDAECQTMECVDNQCIYKDTDADLIEIKGHGNPNLALGSKVSVKDRLQNLFKKVYNSYKYTVAELDSGWSPMELLKGSAADMTENYTVVVEDALPNISIKYENTDQDIDFASDLEDTYPPVVAAVMGSDNLALDTITVSSPKGGAQIGGVVKGRNGMLLAELKFYAWADKNHMPIAEVKVDFGNGLGASGSEGRLQNRKVFCGGQECVDGDETPYEGLTCSGAGYCSEITGDNDSACVNVTSFGNSADACVEEYFSYYGLYMCKSGEGLDVCAGAAGSVDDEGKKGYELAEFAEKGCWDPDYVDPASSEEEVTGACVFVPRVQVIDNWGWCNGHVAYASDEDRGGYYDGSPDGANDCDLYNLDKKAAATYFNGKIVVVP